MIFYIAVFAALWIVYRVLQAFWASQTLDSGFWKEFLEALAKMAIVTSLIAIPPDKEFSINNIVYDKIITPIMGFSIEASKVFTNSVNDVECTRISPRTSNDDEEKVKGVLPDDLKQGIYCQMERFSFINSRQMLMGKIILADASLNRIKEYQLPDFQKFLVGGLLVYMSLYLLWKIGIKFLDTIFSLGIFAMLLPFLLVAWIFPVTKSYFDAGWKKVISAAVTLFVLNFTVALGAGLIDANFFGFEGGMSRFDMLIAENNRQAIAETISLVDISFLEMLVITFIIAYLIEQSSSLVSEYIGQGSEAESTISGGITTFFNSVISKIRSVKITSRDKVK
jgi:hypothetical protein